VLVVAKVPLHVGVTGPLPLVAQSAKAPELAARGQKSGRPDWTYQNEIKRSIT